jgi:hypothetical protein
VVVFDQLEQDGRGCCCWRRHDGTIDV